MARGWEGKSVEEQRAAADVERAARREPPLTEAERARKRQRMVLSLARARVLQDLQAACDRHYRAGLEAALADLDEKIRALG